MNDKTSYIPVGVEKCQTLSENIIRTLASLNLLEIKLADVIATDIYHGDDPEELDVIYLSLLFIHPGLNHGYVGKLNVTKYFTEDVLPNSSLTLKDFALNSVNNDDMYEINDKGELIFNIWNNKTLTSVEAFTLSEIVNIEPDLSLHDL